MRLSIFGLIASTSTFLGCNAANQVPVTVAVYPGAQNCTVKLDDVEQPVACAAMGKHLLEQLKIPVERQIDVSMFRMEKSHNEKDIDAVAEVIRAAGYKDVKVWRFGLE